jgi:hypothetical protein
MFMCLQIFIAGVAHLYDKISASFIVQHPFFRLGDVESPTPFGAYRATQLAHIESRAVSLPAQVIAALDGDTTLPANILREVLTQLPALLQQATPHAHSEALAAPSLQAFGVASPATNQLLAVALMVAYFMFLV